MQQGHVHMHLCLECEIIETKMMLKYKIWDGYIITSFREPITTIQTFQRFETLDSLSYIFKFDFYNFESKRYKR